MMMNKIMYAGILAFLFLNIKCVATANKMNEEIILTIWHYKVPCVGEEVRLCYLVKKDESEPQYFYDSIEGFTYEWGFTYKISVEKVQVTQPQADASSYQYKLKKVLKKEKVSPEETFSLKLKIEDRNLIEVKNGGCYYFGEQKINIGKYTCDQLAKATSATFSHDSKTTDLVLVNLKM